MKKTSYLTPNDQNHRETLKAIRQASQKELTREEAKRQLIKDGFLTKKGKLALAYR